MKVCWGFFGGMSLYMLSWFRLHTLGCRLQVYMGLRDASILFAQGLGFQEFRVRVLSLGFEV